MFYAVVKGTVVSTQKVDSLKGVTFKVMTPCGQNQQENGQDFIAVDPIGARAGDFVMWVGKREASMALAEAGIKNDFPVDAAITGIIDDIG